MQASFKGRGEVSEKMLGMGASIDLQDKHVMTARDQPHKPYARF